MPTVLQMFESIAETYGKLHKVQEQRLDHLKRARPWRPPPRRNTKS